MKVELKTITPNAEVTIVEIARVSSSRKDKSEKPEGLLNYLLKHKHFSPFEHASITFDITTSKAIGIQLIRHRSFTFQEFSQRYQDISRISERS
jgi:thymidylate synthase (FAD)